MVLDILIADYRGDAASHILAEKGRWLAREKADWWRSDGRIDRKHFEAGTKLFADVIIAKRCEGDRLFLHQLKFLQWVSRQPAVQVLRSSPVGPKPSADRPMKQPGTRKKSASDDRCDELKRPLLRALIARN